MRLLIAEQWIKISCLPMVIFTPLTRDSIDSLPVALNKYKTCSSCGKSTILWKSNPKLCKNCTLQSKVKSLKNFKHPKNNYTKVYKYKRKTTGERELFLSIWLKRPHKCENCCTYLGEEPKTFYFSHIKSKGAYPELRLVEENIEILCLNCHQAWENNKELYHKRTVVKTTSQLNTIA